MSEYSNETLTALLGKLDEKIGKGFDGVHKRQDKTNGNITANTKEINKLKLWRSSLMGVWSVVSAIVIWIVYKIF